MPKDRIIAMVMAAAFAAVSQASAYDVLIEDDTGLLGGHPFSSSATVTLVNTSEIFSGDSNTDGWGWSILCNGCIVTGYTYNEVFPGFLNWWNTAISGSTPPAIDVNPAPPGYDSHIQGIGGFNTATSIPAPQSAFVTGWVTVHITAASGSVASGLSGGEGFFLGASSLPAPATNFLTWAPEPGAALLNGVAILSLGLIYRVRKQKP